MRAPSTGPCEVCGALAWNAQNRCRVCRAREARERWGGDAVARAKQRIYQREWRAANPAKQRAADRRKNYGITDAEVERRMREQAGRCAICRVSEATSIDHCHVSGRIRSILCRACNAGLGLFRDDARLLRAAAAYLNRPNPE